MENQDLKNRIDKLEQEVNLKINSLSVRIGELVNKIIRALLNNDDSMVQIKNLYVDSRSEYLKSKERYDADQRKIILWSVILSIITSVAVCWLFK